MVELTKNSEETVISEELERLRGKIRTQKKNLDELEWKGMSYKETGHCKKLEVG